MVGADSFAMESFYEPKSRVIITSCFYICGYNVFIYVVITLFVATFLKTQLNFYICYVFFGAPLAENDFVENKIRSFT